MVTVVAGQVFTTLPWQALVVGELPPTKKVGRPTNDEAVEHG